MLAVVNFLIAFIPFCMPFASTFSSFRVDSEFSFPVLALFLFWLCYTSIFDLADDVGFLIEPIAFIAAVNDHFAAFVDHAVIALAATAAQAISVRVGDAEFVAPAFDQAHFRLNQLLCVVVFGTLRKYKFILHRVETEDFPGSIPGVSIGFYFDGVW
jgi:hypothetical protein